MENVVASIWPRVNTVLLLVLSVALIGLFSSRALSGPLDPPGPVGPTDGVRQAGTPISAIPFTITQPGNYYLTRNLAIASAESGVTIQSSNVTLDLNGFALQGNDVGVNGIFVDGVQLAITIKNGKVTGWFNGIAAANAVHSRVSDVDVYFNGISSFDGSIGLMVGPASIIEGCSVTLNEATGVHAQDVFITGCLIEYNGNDGLRLTGRATVQNTVVQRNRTYVGTWGDVRISSWENKLTDSSLGHVLIDLSETNVYYALARNTYCGVTTTGGGIDFGQWLDNVEVTCF